MTLPMLRRLHRWVALVVGVQVLLWCVSGATFAWLDQHAVTGQHLVRDVAAPAVPTGLAVSDPREWLPPDAGVIREVRLQRLLDRWVYRVESAAGVTLHDAVDGRPLTIDAGTVRALSAARYAGAGAVVEVAGHAAGTLEVRKHGAAWSVRYDDGPGTTLWFSAADGALLEARSDTWRVFDFLWMLHTMDYGGRDDFNNPLVILCATAALWVALVGLLLVVRIFSPRASAETAGH